MIIIKKNKDKAWINFIIDIEAEEVFIKGSWSGWKEEKMKQRKDGKFYMRRKLPLNETYEFGYLVNGKWINDENCETVDSPFGSKNSVLKL